MDSKLIITADDFGMSEHANLGILYCMKLNLIDAISVCVNPFHEKIDQDIKLLPKNHSCLMGLHFNFTEGIALSPAKQLSKSGALKPAITLLNDARLISREVFRGEMLHQLVRFERLFQHPPKHLDSHQHITYLIPNAFSAMLSVSEEMSIPIRSPNPFIDSIQLAYFKEKIQVHYGKTLPFSTYDRANELNRIFHTFNTQLKTNHVNINFSVTSDFQHIRDESTEIVCHPSMKNGEANKDIRYLLKYYE